MFQSGPWDSFFEGSVLLGCGIFEGCELRFIWQTLAGALAAEMPKEKKEDRKDKDRKPKDKEKKDKKDKKKRKDRVPEPGFHLCPKKGKRQRTWTLI